MRFGRAGRFGGFCWVARAVWRGWLGGPWRVWPGCLTWGLGLREQGLASRSNLAMAFKAFECVLSEGLAVGRGLLAALRGFGRWMVPVHGGVLGVRAHACIRLRGCVRDEQEKGIGWMPWRQEAMKDVARCENPGEAASGR